MELYRKARRFGCFVIACAVTFRLFAAGIPQQVFHQLTQYDFAPIFLFLETGRYVRSSDSKGQAPSEAIETEPEAPPEQSADSPPAPAEAPSPEELLMALPAWTFPIEIFPAQTVPEETAPEVPRPVFTAEDAARISVTDFCNAKPPLEELLLRPLDWDLTGEAPTVLILHTHATESYTRNGETYAESSPYRTLEEAYNMLSLGDRVTELLEAGGISVIHDRSLHDHPSYNDSYSHARKAIQSLLEEYPTIQLVLDLHRDAADGDAGQLRTRAQAKGAACAQLMLVMGTGNAGKTNDRWLENLAFGTKLHALLQQKYPGLMRPISLRSQRFNQDLASCSLLVEIGAAGNTHSEARIAAELLAEGILELKNGT